MKRFGLAGMYRRTRLVPLSALAGAALVFGCADADRGIVGPGDSAPTASTTAYATVIGNDWKSYTSDAALDAANLFWWYRPENVNDHVDLVPDPTFGQVARIKFQQSDSTGFAPKMMKQFPAPMDHIWFRWRIKYTPGWTTAGPNPTGYANSWKMAFWTWSGYGGRGAIQLSNTDQNILEWNVMDRATGQFYSYSEQVLPGGMGSPLGSVSQAWQDGEWYEYVIHYQRISDTQAKQEYWYRKLTSGGAIANNAYLYHGAVFTGSPMPRPAGIELGVNKNKSNPTTMYLSWGPWEVVDGNQYPNPFGMPNQGGALPAPSTPTLSQVVLTPATASVQTGSTLQFAASGRMSDGSTSSVAVTYAASGGTVTSSGLYTAPATAGTYQVVATAQGSTLADTSVVTVAAPATATLTRVVLSPASVSLQTAGTAQFQASGQYSDGSTRAVSVTYSATGGTISSAGLYTAGSTAGTYRVIATAVGAPLADTSAVTLSVPTSGTPAPPPTTGSYATLAGDNWSAYTASSQIQGFSWSDSRNVYGYVSLVQDATFGKVVRITQPAGSSATPSLSRSVGTRDRVWYRWRVKFSPGWTTAGSGSGAATYTMGEWNWASHWGDGSVGFNNKNYYPRFGVQDPATRKFINYNQTALPGSTGGLGSVGTEWQDGEWYEIVAYYEKTGATTARQRYWKRRLTSGGQVASNPWTYYGFSLAGATTPQVGSIVLGGPKGRNTSADQHLFWGPWEVVDGSQYPNPFGMPNL